MLDAFGTPPALAVVVLAYFVGQVANTLPVPGAVSGGMVGVLLAFGVDADLAVVSVLAYRAVAIWLPAPFGLRALAAPAPDGRRLGPRGAARRHRRPRRRPPRSRTIRRVALVGAMTIWSLFSAFLLFPRFGLPRFLQHGAATLLALEIIAILAYSYAAEGCSAGAVLSHRRGVAGPGQPGPSRPRGPPDRPGARHRRAPGRAHQT